MRNPVTKISLLLVVGLLVQTVKLSAQAINLDSLPKVRYANAINSGKVVFPVIDNYRGEHVFFINDPVFGKVPFRVFISATYNRSTPTPLILLLHGAVKASKFSDAFGTHPATEADDDPFYKKLCETGYIIVMPYGDPGKKFSWGVNLFRPNQNLTYKTLAAIVKLLKATVNIDDNKVFAMGHSDGSDGAFGFDVYEPTLFAGFLSYNSMLKNIFADDMYIQNTVNRPLYLVHSDLDNLRPIEQTRAIVKLMDSLKVPLTYKEYKGYKHSDKHLDIDLPLGLAFIKNTTRNPFPNNIYWETSNLSFNQCDWLVVKSLDLKLPNARWYKVEDVSLTVKINQSWLKFNYYKSEPSGAIKATYAKNVFDVSTSRVASFDVLISPAMVDLNKFVTVLVNGKKVFYAKVKADQKFITQGLDQEHDRKAFWVTSISIDAKSSL